MKAARLGSEEVTYPDRISQLPDDLLLRILSLVPVRTAMSTSLLSKRWKPVWKMMPMLVYDETCPYIGSLGFDLFCGVSLPLHEALKTLNLKLGKYSDSIDTLLFPNIGSNLLDMTINLNYYYGYYTPIKFPNNLNVFKTLFVLKLQGKIVLDVVDSPVCFPSLKILHLTCVDFQCEESFTRLLSSCPVLEDLFLQRLCSGGRFLFNMSVPSLQRLSITSEPAYYGSDEPRLEISTPCLKYLKIFDRCGYYNFLEDMPKLVEADVSVDMSKNENLLRVLSSVEHLVICLYPSMVLDLTDSLIFNRLLHLELDVCNSFRSNLLLRLLKYFPNLQSLKLGRTYPKDTEDQLYCLVSEQGSVPKCLSIHLESIQWTGYGGTLDEREAAAYILKNAHRLKTATIRLHTTCMENGQIMMKDLTSMSKALASCYLVGVRNLNGFSSGLAQAKVDLSKLLANNVEMETYEGNVITLEATYRRLPPICS
ncbi:unnamed protein product [Brassica rapa]|nr:unnamed protein product [Brassica rapa]VDC79661.1 unnamed protein product [Brassica rapa]